MTPQRLAEEIRQLQYMRCASLLAGTTLLLLLFVAMPLKYLATLPVATSIMGPAHGVAFLVYAWMLIQTISGGGWTGREALCMATSAFIPFGGLINERMLARRQTALERGRVKSV